MSKLINFRVRSFTFFVGTFDASTFVTAFNLSVPISEFNADLYWRGQFTVTRPYISKATLAESEFSELETPTRWRDGQQPVTISINGFLLPALRIQNYEWDEETQTGTGDLVQLPVLTQFERVGEEIPDTEFAAGLSIDKVIKNMIVIGGRINGFYYIDPNAVVIPPVADAVLDVKLISKDPAREAQTYAGSIGRFLTQTPQALIVSVPYPDPSDPLIPLLKRSLSEVVPLKREKEQNFAADKIQVTGSKQVAKLPEPTPPANPNDDFDEKGRPRYLRTLTVKPIGELFPEQLPGDTREVTVEIKEIFYRYVDKRDILFDPTDYVNVTPPVITAINQYPIVLSILKRDELIQTITVQQQIIAELFKNDLPDALQIPALPKQPLRFANEFEIPSYTGIPSAYFGFVVSNITIETEYYRWSFVPKGIKFSGVDLGYNWSNKLPLVLDRKEDLRSKLPGKTVLENILNPKTGKSLKVEEQPELEPLQPAPDFEFDTVTFNGFYELSPIGYNTFLPKVYQENFGFIPSQYWANKLAELIAHREVGRREGKYYLMPIPIEWLSAGCPLFPCFDIHKSRYIAENLTIIFEEDQCYFKFFGSKVGSIPAVPDPNPYPIYIPTESLQIVPHPGINVRVGDSV